MLGPGAGGIPLLNGIVREFAGWTVRLTGSLDRTMAQQPGLVHLPEAVTRSRRFYPIGFGSVDVSGIGRTARGF